MKAPVRACAQGADEWQRGRGPACSICRASRVPNVQSSRAERKAHAASPPNSPSSRAAGLQSRRRHPIRDSSCRVSKVEYVALNGKSIETEPERGFNMDEGYLASKKICKLFPCEVGHFTNFKLTILTKPMQVNVTRYVLSKLCWVAPFPNNSHTSTLTKLPYFHSICRT